MVHIDGLVYVSSALCFAQQQLPGILTMLLRPLATVQPVDAWPIRFTGVLTHVLIVVDDDVDVVDIDSFVENFLSGCCLTVYFSRDVLPFFSMLLRLVGVSPLRLI